MKEMLQTVHYEVNCKELDIYKRFDNPEIAHLFAEQLKQDFPNALIERFKCTNFYDEWELYAINGGADEQTSH